MTKSSNDEGTNPYDPPATSLQQSPNSTAIPAAADRRMINNFRQQIHALGGFWIFIGCVIVLAALFADDRSNVVILGTVGVISVGLGIFTCLKQMWAVYCGLIPSYLLFGLSLLSLNFCGILVLLAVILQAHRVINWANRMRNAGIPLTAKG